MPFAAETYFRLTHSGPSKNDNFSWIYLPSRTVLINRIPIEYRCTYCHFLELCENNFGMVNFLVNKNEYNCQNFFLMLINSVSRKYALYRKEKSTQQKWIKVFLTLYKLKGLIVSFIHLGARRCVCVMCITFRLKILKGDLGKDEIIWIFQV